MRRTLIINVGLVVILVVGLVSCGDDEVTVPSFAGRLVVELEGLPPGAVAEIAVTGPGGEPEVFTGGGDLGLVPPGRYEVAAGAATHPFGDYYPDALTRPVTVVAGNVTTVTLRYRGLMIRGGLVARIDGLPAELAPTLAVSGPDGFAAELALGDTLVSLATGIYHVAGPRLMQAEQVYAPWPEAIPVEVAAGTYNLATVTYAPAHDVDLDLAIARVEFIQSTQRENGGVPLIAGREALMRVYGLATAVNDVAPPVHVEWFVDDQPQGEEVLHLAAAATPTVLVRDDLDATWNAVVPATLVAPGLGVRLTIDPDDQVPEYVEANNRFDAFGTAGPTVVERPVLEMRLVPILQEANGLQGDATPENADDHVSLARLLAPVPDIDVDLHPVFTTSAPPLQADNGNNAWGRILSEITGLRALEDPGRRHYYGVVKVDYTSGIAGLGRLAGYVAMGWDYDGSREEVLAHELGHNLGLLHVDCGGPDAVDPDYPYWGGFIGQWGYDPIAGILRDPAEDHDLMSYCQPKWISDYMFEEMLAYEPPTEIATPTTCLLVWGQRHQGKLILDPALVVEAVPSLPSQPGPYRIEARDHDGRAVVSASFAMPAFPDLPGGDAAFAWTIPLAPDRAPRLADLTLSGPGESVRRVRDVQAPAPLAAPSLARDGDVTIRWDATSQPLILVQRPDRTVLGVLRDGKGQVRTEPGPFTLLISDGVASHRVDAVAP